MSRVPGRSGSVLIVCGGCGWNSVVSRGHRNHLRPILARLSGDLIRVLTVAIVLWLLGRKLLCHEPEHSIAGSRWNGSELYLFAAPSMISLARLDVKLCRNSLRPRRGHHGRSRCLAGLRG